MKETGLDYLLKIHKKEMLILVAAFWSSARTETYDEPLVWAIWNRPATKPTQRFSAIRTWPPPGPCVETCA